MKVYLIAKSMEEGKQQVYVQGAGGAYQDCRATRKHTAKGRKAYKELERGEGTKNMSGKELALAPQHGSAQRG